MTASEFLRSVKVPVGVTDDGWIVLENRIIRDSVFLSDETVIVNKLSIKGCTFKDYFTISNWTFEDIVEFEGCVFEKGLWIEGGVFKNRLDLKWITSRDSFVLKGGQFQTIYLSLKETRNILITGGEFDELNFGDLWGGDDNFEQLEILNRGSLIGNINIVSKTIKKVLLYGGNFDRDFVFQRLKCEYFYIGRFTNSGNLKFFDLQPIHGQTTFFEVVESNLSKAQLFGVRFDQFSEVIVIDSYISEINVINSTCRDDNFRALYGPQHIDYSKNRSPINSDELMHLKEVFRQLKYVYDKQGDRINENRFYSLEMNAYNSLLKWTGPHKEIFWQKLILILSRILTNYGASFLRPLIGVLFSNLFILFILILLFNYKGLTIVDPFNADRGAFKIAIGEYFTLINPVHKMDESLTSWAVMWDLISRIVSSYFIFGLIRSSRRFLR